MKKVPVCPMCGGTSSVLYEAVDENQRISADRFCYMKCFLCKTIFLAEPPMDIARYYQSDYYDIPSLKKLDAVACKDTNKLDTVLRFKQGGHLLEVGPAFGVFAWQAKKAGFSVRVIEMDARCCDYLRKEVGVDVVHGDRPEKVIATLPQHDVIAVWHVLEHLPAPIEFLQAAAANLMPGGVLVIAMPNPDAFQFRIMGRHWPHLDAPRHLTLIPPAILRDKAGELGLEQLYFASNDSDARSWNRFGWQRLLMNRFTGKFAKRSMFVVGYALALIMAPLDRQPARGSAYTVIFRKK